MKLILLLMLFTISSLASAAKYAVVVSSKAVVFSDMALDSAIGYIAAGKLVQVGEKLRMKGAVLPIIVSGKIAYIQVKDLRFVKDKDQVYSPKITEHVIDNEQFYQGDTIKEHNHLVVQIGQYSLGENWENISRQAGSELGRNMTYYNFMLEHRSPMKSYSFGIGGTYQSVTQTNLKASAYSLDGQIYYSALKFPWLSLDLLLGASGSLSMRVKVADVEGTSSGVFYGWNTGIQARLFPEKKIGFIIGLGYRRTVVSSIKEIIFPDNSVAALDLLSGTQAYAGLSYRF